MEQLLSAKQVAAALQVSENYVYDLASRGELASFKIRGNRRFRECDVDEYVERHRAPAKVSPIRPARERSL